MSDDKQSDNESKEKRFSQTQYDMLKRCSDKKDMTEWNQWRKKNPDEEIWLEEAPLGNCWLEGVLLGTGEVEIDGITLKLTGEVLLWKANFWNTNLQEARLEEVNLQKADLGGANLQKAHLRRANLQGADLFGTNLQGADLLETNLQEADLGRANLQGATSWYGTNLQKAKLVRTNLQGARLREANLQGATLVAASLVKADLGGANLQRAIIYGAILIKARFCSTDLREVSFGETRLEGADFSYAIVDGKTSISGQVVDKGLVTGVDRETMFEGVGLDSMRIDPGIKQLLLYNIRRRNWEDWYWGSRQHKLIKDYEEVKPYLKAIIILIRLIITIPIRLFWKLTNYGLSTIRVISWFFMFALIFAGIYYKYPDCLLIRGQVGELRGFLHAFYFSVVTMTTLGFGDIHANPDNTCGLWLLIVQVLLGYIMLGALVTRFAVLFQAGGPAGKFVKMTKEEKKQLKELEKENPD